MLAVAAVAIALVAVFYYRAFGTLKRAQWQTLLALRIAAILVLILLLFRPVFSYHKQSELRPALILLMDTSASMSISDGPTGASRFNQVRGEVQKWCEKLKDDFALHLVEFAENPRELESVEELAMLAPTGKSTSISGALMAAGKTLPRRDVEAVILLSDGVNNSARSPDEVALKLGMPVHTVGVGASLRSDVSYRDVQMTGINCPDRLLLNNQARIAASVEGVGMAGRVVKVVLEEDNKALEEKELTLDQVEGAQEVNFDFRPTAKGRHTYTVRVPAAAEEKIQENNQRSAVALVVEPGIRVLYIEGTLRAEYGALVDRFLAKDPDLEFCALVQTRPNFFLKRSNMEGLELKAIPTDQAMFDKFDVFIFGDLDSSYLRGPQQEMLTKRIRDGAGVIMLGGYHSLGPGGYAGTPLGQVLPVRLGSREIGQMTDPFLPILTPDGTHHAIFANISEFFPTQQGDAKTSGLPVLEGCTRVEGAQPGATVLATVATEGGPMPVLAVQAVGKGRTAVFTGDTTRKWQQGPRVLDMESPYLRFWGQTVRWLAGRETTVEAKAGVTASTDKAHYEPEEGILISAVVRDKEGEGSAGAVVEAKITGPGGRPDKTALSAIAGPAGHYGGTYEPTAAGTYMITVEAKVGEATLGAEKLTVEVGRPNLEFERLDLDEKMLTRIAAGTGARYVHITTADRLIEQLDRTRRKKDEFIEKQLYWPPMFWVLFVGVLTVEWVLRRKFQLR